MESKAPPSPLTQAPPEVKGEFPGSKAERPETHAPTQQASQGPPGVRPPLAYVTPQSATSNNSPTKILKTTSSSGVGDSQPVYIGYGSQTGCAKSIAQNLLARCRDTGIPAECMELDKWKTMEPGLSDLRLAVVVISTTGDGDPPMGSEKLYRFIKRKSQATTLMEKTQFAVLALGDTNYDKFCFMGKFFHRRMKELGAAAFKDLTMADEGTGQLDEVVEDWLDAIVKALGPLVMQQGADIGDEEVKGGDLPPASVGAAQTGLVPLQEGHLSSLITQTVGQHIGPLGRERKVRPIGHFFDAIATGQQGGGGPAPCESYYPAERACELYDVTFGTVPNNGTTNTARGDDGIGVEYEATVTDARYLTSGGAKAERRVVHVELQIANNNNESKMAYKVGDAVGLRCPNNPADAASMLRLLVDRTGVDPDAPFLVVDKETGRPCGSDEQTLTLRRLLREVVDLSAPLRPGIVRALAQHASDPVEAQILHALTRKSGEGKRAFDAFVSGQALHLVELLECFPSCSPPMALIAASLPRLAPRFYSIASSPVSAANTHLATRRDGTDDDDAVLAIAFSVELWGAGLTSRTGLCTGYLENLLTPAPQDDSNNASTGSNGGKGRGVAAWTPELPAPLLLSLRSATDFTLPGDPSIPVIMIGPGTGVAPFMGFIAERRAQKKNSMAGKLVGDMLLYYGGRNESKDWLYREDMLLAQEDGVLTRLRTAWSRDGPAKRYVQHCMEEDADELGRLILQQGAFVFICGDGRHMAPDVHAALVRIVANACEGGDIASVKETKAAELLATMKHEGRYVADIWST